MIEHEHRALDGMKVLQIHNRYAASRGGEDVVADAEQELLTARGHSVRRYLRDNAEFYRLSLPGKIRVLVGSAWSGPVREELRMAIRGWRPDIVHVHNHHFMVTAAVFQTCHDSGVPVVQTLHNYRHLCSAANFLRQGRICKECVDVGALRGIRYGCYRKSHLLTAVVARNTRVAERRGLRNGLVDRFIALTEFAKQQFVAAGFPADRMSVKPNFIADPGIGRHDGGYALFVGRISPEKGVDVLLRAWKILGRSLPLVVVGLGDPPHLRGLEGLAVRAMGAQPRERVLELMKNATVLVFPSVWFEGFPMTLVEAMATGLPIVASRLGSMQEIVANDQSGVLFEPGDADALAQAVSDLVTRPRLLVKLGSNGRRAYEAHYTPDRNLGLLMDIYESAIKRYSAASRQ